MDVNLTRESLLKETHRIGRVAPSGGSLWTFAVGHTRNEEILARPCGRRVILGDWMIDLETPGRLVEAPVQTIRGILSDPDGAAYMWNWHEVACFDRQCCRWNVSGLFNADFWSVDLREGQLTFRGYLDWVEPGRLFTLLLDPGTGQIAGGDPEALEAHRSAGDLPA